ncbi:hypothetical protein SEA_PAULODIABOLI_242 [Microbacterium phage PauloDiaboli]|nr:hypothetical protein SEA_PAULODIABOLI_242 [Microbacterium phage PauloDiaboli]
MYAIYFEFARESDKAVYQCLFIPATPIGASVIPPTFGYKELSPANPRRAWNLVSNNSYALDGIIAGDMVSLMDRELKQFEGLSTYMTSVLSDPAWKTVGAFPVEVLSGDLLTLKEKSTRMPPPLNARIKNLRSQKGFPDLPGAAS